MRGEDKCFKSTSMETQSTAFQQIKNATGSTCGIMAVVQLLKINKLPPIR
jgi:hypothetical protein